MRALLTKLRNSIHRLDRWMTASKRRYLYRVVNAVLGAAVVFGVLDGHREAALLLVVNAVLGLADAKAAD